MAAESPRAPLSVYMLADHLDAALAAGEDLIARGNDWRALVETPGNAQTFPARQREILDELRAFELIMIARTLKARDHGRALANVDARFGSIAGLFASATGLLLDAVEECGDATDEDFETGDGLTAYVRSRGMIAPDAIGHGNAATISVDDTFLIAKRIPLGVLMDLTSSFLDALEVHYELYTSDADEFEPVALAGTSSRHGLLDEPADDHDVMVTSESDGVEEAEPATVQAEGSETETGDNESTTPPVDSPVSVRLPPSPLSKLYRPRREFGQRQRPPLN